MTPETRASFPLAKYITPATRVSFPLAKYITPATRVSFPLSKYITPATRVSFPLSIYGEGVADRPGVRSGGGRQAGGEVRPRPKAVYQSQENF